MTPAQPAGSAQSASAEQELRGLQPGQHATWEAPDRLGRDRAGLNSHPVDGRGSSASGSDVSDSSSRCSSSCTMQVGLSLLDNDTLFPSMPERLTSRS